MLLVLTIGVWPFFPLHFFGGIWLLCLLIYSLEEKQQEFFSILFSSSTYFSTYPQAYIHNTTTSHVVYYAFLFYLFSEDDMNKTKENELI